MDKSALGNDSRDGWGTYFGVADTDSAADRVTSLGGTVVREPADSPFGRVAGVTDPAGLEFSIISVD